jgi:DNA-binding Lrp family transcriptional regulator
MERIYILAKVETNTVEDVVKALTAIKGIKTLDVVTGPYDLMITLEGESVAKMLSSVVREIRNIQGIISTETLVGIKLD